MRYIQEIVAPDTSLSQACMLGEEQEWREFREIFVSSWILTSREMEKLLFSLVSRIQITFCTQILLEEKR